MSTRLEKVAGISPELKSRLEEANQRRRYLAHHFFREEIDHVALGDVTALLRQLEQDRRFFTRLTGWWTHWFSRSSLGKDLPRTSRNNGSSSMWSNFARTTAAAPLWKVNKARRRTDCYGPGGTIRNPASLLLVLAWPCANLSTGRSELAPLSPL